MHIPSYNSETDPTKLAEFIRANALGLLITDVESQEHPLLQASHLPWVLKVGDDETDTSKWRLQGHLARANPQTRAIVESVTQSDAPEGVHILSKDILIIFNGLDHYVTPKFYQQTKPDTGKVVPTWDYEAVQVYGKAHVYVDGKSEKSKSFLASHLDHLSEHMEMNVMKYQTPWKVADAPKPYIDILSKAILGIEIEVTSVAGRFKWSQEKPKGDRQGVLDGFKNMDHPSGPALGERVQTWADFHDEKKKRAANK
ncbi:Hypothetical protein D9617_20g028940 [Elsinoe fawcettii]|nr:Hypothetical protein D9617_20g028940 [Elsinoe fawcettii]